MNRLSIRWLSLPFLACLFLTLSGCIAGRVHHADGNVLDGVEVTAFAECKGAGCEAARIIIPQRNGPLTGYRTMSSLEGHYFYDPYGESVPAAAAMGLAVPASSEDGSVKLAYRKQGFSDIWLDYVPEYRQYTGDKGQPFYVARVPELYLCPLDAADSDGDTICDAAEAFYNTDPFLADSDDNGIDDHRQLFGSGPLITMGTQKILHANVNVSDFEASKRFYQLLGFRVLLDIDVDVSDPEEAAGLALPPYQLRAAPMALSDGYVMDLIQWQTPYEPSAPYASQQNLGLTTLSLLTNNLAADMAVLEDNGIAFTGPVDVSHPTPGSRKILFTDPDGAFIELTEPSGALPDDGPNASGLTYITGALETRVNVSDYQRALSFYQHLGFTITAEHAADAAGPRSASLSLPGGHHLVIVQSERSAGGPYEALNHIGIARIAIETANIDEDIRLLEAQGIEFFSEPITPSGPLGILRYACFQDPDGTVIELVQYN